SGSARVRSRQTATARPRLWAIALALLAAALLAAPSAALAQLDELKDSTPKQRATVETAFMRRKLELTPQQDRQVSALNLKYAEQMQGVIGGSDGPFMKLRAAEAIDKEKDSALQGILSPAQFQQYQAAKQELRTELETKLAGKLGGGAAQ